MNADRDRSEHRQPHAPDASDPHPVRLDLATLAAVIERLDACGCPDAADEVREMFHGARSPRAGR